MRQGISGSSAPVVDELRVHAFEIPTDGPDGDLSAHCAPAASAHAFCAVPRLRHLEYFHDHVRIESMLFDGTLSPEGGTLRPDPGRPGLGLDVRWADAEPYRVHGRGR